MLAAEHPERVDGLVFIGPAVAAGAGRSASAPRYSVRRASSTPTRAGRSTTGTTGCATTRTSSSSSSRRCFTEPHSTKPIEDASAGASRRRRETLIATQRGLALPRTRRRASSAARVRCPVLVIHGSDDAITSRTRGRRARRGDRRRSSCCSRAPATARTRATRSRSTCCCATSSRRAPPPRSWVRGRSRRKRALYISSPIGLGHAQRDVAIADELRRLHPDLEIDWLAQHPVTRGARGARRAHPPGERAPRERVAPHRERVGRARPALLPGDPPDGRDPARQLHGLPRPRPRGALRPLDRRRGLGARLLPAREPRAEAGRLRRG